MRFMSIVKGPDAGVPPSRELMEAIIRLSGGNLTVTDGPFTEAKEVVGGYAIVKADSKAEAVEMGRRFMQLHADILGSDAQLELEIRQMFDGPPPA